MNSKQQVVAPCNICGSSAGLYGKAIIRSKHQATYLRCPNCEFIFVYKPTWLDEAYAEPINLTDTGYVSRNLSCQVRLQMLIELFLKPSGQFLDYAAGYGLLVRLMRDLGYDFRWYDQFCINLFARGFECPYPPQTPMDAVTAFEVFEHLVDPMSELEALAKITDCLIFTTELLPHPAPGLTEWSYFGLEHGQHVAFYTRKCLEIVGQKFGYCLTSDGHAFHVLSRTPMPAKLLNRMDSGWWKRWIRRTRGRPGLSGSDHALLKQKLRQIEANRLDK